MKSAGSTGFERLLTCRLHVLNKLSERGSALRYRAKLGVTLSEARVIAAVGSFGPLSVIELARHANLDKSQASRAAEAAMQRGLIRREASDDDGRIVLLSLAPSGRALYRRIVPIACNWDVELFACLDGAERAVLLRMLDRVIASAKTGGI
ncbi:MarR family transcriptional regulator [Burkholderia sp. WAC0059]|uniref:MarR family winged helix-turn-helix transcriptional regulator n=1 Tax=Burkholderia sp. WAC0059 TaxID=2066022 RepID=UPI000C7E8DCE|nr:MarR family transcriptional regulator [Burkholderia sp. WAC0059]PLZ03687.1 MarR family transcriptional regulator [Burkholderia sp. WAC0059]